MGLIKVFFFLFLFFFFFSYVLRKWYNSKNKEFVAKLVCSPIGQARNQVLSESTVVMMSQGHLSNRIRSSQEDNTAKSVAVSSKVVQDLC